MRILRRLVVTLAAVVTSAGCDKGLSLGDSQPAPSASVISIGVAIGTCEDLAVCEKECDAGSADRCRRLAASYAFGQGAAKDEARATRLYEQACAMKDPAACVFAGRMHEYAHGVPRDVEKAAALYSRACDMKWAAGCYNSAIMFENGRGVALDRSKAAALYLIACAAGATAACDKAKEMSQSPARSLVDGSANR